MGTGTVTAKTKTQLDESVSNANRGTATSIDEMSSARAPRHEEIAALAYQYWNERGCPEGCPEDDWYRAEQELTQK